MEKHQYYIAELIKKYLADGLSFEERKELDLWIAASDQNQAFFNKITSYEYLTTEAARFYRYDVEEMKNKIAEVYPAVKAPYLVPERRISIVHLVRTR